MAERRILYLTALTASLVFFWAYREWMSWILLLVMILLPWLSLGVSFAAMRKTGLRTLCPERLGLGGKACVSLVGECPLPQGGLRGKLRLDNLLTGQSLLLRSGEALPSSHCAAWQILPEKCKVFDYLGLFSRRVTRLQGATVYIMPTAVPVVPAPDLSRYTGTSFKPKPGGGYAENHELRLYRPGDNLHQIHWKLTAKTGKLILREPMEPIKGKAVISLELNGGEAAMDRKLGQALWVSRFLLEERIRHELHCLTGDGMKVCLISHSQGLDKAIQSLLRQPMAPEDARIDFIAASWRYHIGGDGHEA